jgi:hypothetical protein
MPVSGKEGVGITPDALSSEIPRFLGYYLYLLRHDINEHVSGSLHSNKFGFFLPEVLTESIRTVSR